MSIAEFLRELQSTGRGRVATSFPPDPPGDELTPVLQGLDARARAEAPGVAPPFGLDAARWGARALYLLAQALTLRHLPAEKVARELRRPCPGSPSAGRTWSVDLALRWLPDLDGLAGGLPPGDPLPALLGEVRAAWPLSSVGVAGPAGAHLDEGELAVVLGHPSLVRLYVDRALAHADADRLRPPRARELARVALGAHPELCPAISTTLFEETSP